MPLNYAGEFRHLDTSGNNLDYVERTVSLPEIAEAPVKQGDVAGRVIYSLNGKEIGAVDILYAETVEKAGYGDYLYRIFQYFLL